MKAGPQIQCQGCGLSVLLCFTVRDGSDRRLVCPFCAHTHGWTVVDTPTAACAGIVEERSTGSSVE